ncbi:glycoside hydrolase family 19 protein [Flavobacterium sp.]|uniref:glycoside hydrolase family 19 protein n=1 Tax=Flavobacterium sp. TaxID=239 RepID=UPI0037501DD4
MNTSKHVIDINQAKCPCKKCTGFGNGKYPEEKNNAKILEMRRKYEYPGMHRTILWVQRAIQFYLATLEKDRKLTVGLIFSGYRCNINNQQKGRSSTNHMGKASDLHIYGGAGDREKNANAVRDVLVKYTGAKYRWNDQNVIALEADNRNGTASDFKASTWVHYDVRTFELKYLEDKYFAKTMADCNGKNIVVLANELGFQKTCMCNPAKAAVVPLEKSDIKAGCYCKNELTDEVLQKIAPNASNANVKKYLDGFNETFKKFNIDSCLKKIHFFGQVIVESGSFKYNIEEGSAAYLAKYDGWHGRGLIQLTTKPNYEAFEKAVGEDFTSSDKNRDKVAESPYAVYSAGWFWDNRSLNELAAKNDFIYICYKVNGGFNHIDDRLKAVKKGFEILYKDCVNDKDKKTDYKFSDSKANDSKKAAFAWALWHDPVFTKTGCEKSKEKAIEGYQRYINLTDENDSTTNYYGIQNLSHFEDLVTLVKKGKKMVKELKVREAAAKRLKELK